MPTSSLDSLETGKTAIIVALENEPGLHHRLYALGFRYGRQIHMVRRGWLSGPLHVRIGTTEIMLRRREAQAVRTISIAAGV
jgi:ferrous iron transport protein A